MPANAYCDCGARGLHSCVLLDSDDEHFDRIAALPDSFSTLHENEGALIERARMLPPAERLRFAADLIDSVNNGIVHRNLMYAARELAEAVAAGLPERPGGQG
jgi:hypothetical protein